jgi:hypothetical protein
MKRWILPAVALALAAVIAWPFLFGGATVEVKGKSFAVEHRLADDGPHSRRYPTRGRAALAAGNAILCSWDRDRYLHFSCEGSKAVFDVAFLDAAGKVLQVARMRPYRGSEHLDDEGISSTVEARRALFLPEGAMDNLTLAAGDTVALSSDLSSAKPEPMTTIKIANLEVRVELAETARQRSFGLMHRPKMSAGEGMLFIYPSSRTGLSFYMRNTLMSLDIAYFDANGKLVNAYSAERAENPRLNGADRHAPAASSAQYVLEMPIGWFRQNGLADAQGKPVKEVGFELSDAFRKRAAQSEEQR